MASDTRQQLDTVVNRLRTIATDANQYESWLDNNREIMEAVNEIERLQARHAVAVELLLEMVNDLELVSDIDDIPEWVERAREIVDGSI